MTKRHALETVRLRLRPAAPEHAELAWPGLNDDAMWEYFPALRPPTLEALRVRYQRWSHELPYLGAPERWENWIAFERTTGAAAGELQATYAGATVYVAYGIFSRFRLRGYAVEGASEVLRHAREAHGSRVAIAQMAAQNRASVAVAERLGFTRAAKQPTIEAGVGSACGEYVYRRDLVNSSASK